MGNYNQSCNQPCNPSCVQPEFQQCQRCGSLDLNNMPIAMAYVPWQYFDKVYEVDKALQYGTIFPELNKPFYGKRGVRA